MTPEEVEQEELHCLVQGFKPSGFAGSTDGLYLETFGCRYADEGPEISLHQGHHFVLFFFLVCRSCQERAFWGEI